LEEALNEVEKLTGSLIGFFHFVDDDQRSLRLQNWSTRTKAVFCSAQGKGAHYPVMEAGVWADCVHTRAPVIYNDYAGLLYRKGMPEGHATVLRELVVPVLRGDKLTALLGVGNKATDYTEADVQVVALLAELAWELAERKRAEDSLRRSNRQLRAISACNQMLMRATDEGVLLDEECRIVCEQAGYAVAWAGFVESSHPGVLTQVALAGAAPDEASELGLALTELSQGCEAAQEALHSGAAVAIQDLLLDARFTAWREPVGERGFRSAIWLPLKDDHEAVFGVLLILSRDTGAFDDEEIRLLEELTGDLAFGVTVLRARAQRREAERRIALLSFALSNVREAAFLIDEAGRFRDVNDAACRTLGYERDVLLGMTVTDLDPGFPAERWPTHWTELVAQRAMIFESHHRAQDGRLLPVEVSANYFEYEGQAYNLALAHDITERKHAEAVLREREAFIRSILDSVDEGFIVVDRNLRV